MIENQIMNKHINIIMTQKKIFLKKELNQFQSYKKI